MVFDSYNGTRLCTVPRVDNCVSVVVKNDNGSQSLFNNFIRSSSSCDVGRFTSLNSGRVVAAARHKRLKKNSRSWPGSGTRTIRMPWRVRQAGNQTANRRTSGCRFAAAKNSHRLAVAMHSCRRCLVRFASGTGHKFARCMAKSRPWHPVTGRWSASPPSNYLRMRHIDVDDHAL